MSGRWFMFIMALLLVFLVSCATQPTIPKVTNPPALSGQVYIQSTFAPETPISGYCVRQPETTTNGYPPLSSFEGDEEDNLFYVVIYKETITEGDNLLLLTVITVTVGYPQSVPNETQLIATCTEEGLAFDLANAELGIQP